MIRNKFFKKKEEHDLVTQWTKHDGDHREAPDFAGSANKYIYIYLLFTQVPYDKKSKIPKNAQLRSFHCIERNKLVMMWHHVEDEEAHWIPPVITEVGQNHIRTYQNNQRKIRRKITRVILI